MPVIAHVHESNGRRKRECFTFLLFTCQKSQVEGGWLQRFHNIILLNATGGIANCLNHALSRQGFCLESGWDSRLFRALASEQLWHVFLAPMPGLAQTLSGFQQYLGGARGSQVSSACHAGFSRGESCLDAFSQSCTPHTYAASMQHVHMHAIITP